VKAARSFWIGPESSYANADPDVSLRALLSLRSWLFVPVPDGQELDSLNFYFEVAGHRQREQMAQICARQSNCRTSPFAEQGFSDFSAYQDRLEALKRLRDERCRERRLGEGESVVAHDDDLQC
jgi:hypothetical protein